MADIQLPLEIMPIAGTFCIGDARSRPISYTDFQNAGLAKSSHWNERQAKAIAKVIARLATDRLCK